MFSHIKNGWNWALIARRLFRLFRYICVSIVPISLITILFIGFVVVIGLLGNASENTSGDTNKEVPIGTFEAAPLEAGFVITEEYGWYTGAESAFGAHTGTDMSNGYGAIVMSVLDGTVTNVTTGCTVGNWSCGYGFGNHITIKHTLENGKVIYTRYAHLDTVYVKPGQLVYKGQTIGLQGNTGKSTGTHLHFEVRLSDDYVKDNTRNPRDYFKF